MKTMTLFTGLLFSLTAVAQDVSEDPIGDARIAISQEADFDGARVLLEAFESHALEAAPPVGPGPIAEMNFLIGVLEYYLNQDEEAAKARWRWTLQIEPAFAWDKELVGGAGETIFEMVREEVVATETFGALSGSEKVLLPVHIDGRKLSADTPLYTGQHLIQARCSDGITRGVYAYITASSKMICPCPLDVCIGSESGKKQEASDGESSLGLNLAGGGWYSAGEGFSPLLGVGLSYRPSPSLQVDVEGGAYLAQAQTSRTDGGYAALYLSYVASRDGFELLGGVHANLLFAEDVYYVSSGENTGQQKAVLSPYSGLVGGLHLGAAYTLDGGHQVGVRLGYSPLVVEGESLIYLNSVSSAYFRYAL